MDFFNAFFEFLKKIFSALTKFLGRSIPVISEIEGINPVEEDTEPADEG